MKIGSLKAWAIVHATEDSGKVTDAIRRILQLNGSAEPSVSRAKGHHGNQITTLVLSIKSSRTAEGCLLSIWKRLTLLDKDTVLSTLASRIDRSGTLFLRLDKQAAFKGTLRLNDSDPIKIEISFLSSPSAKNEVRDAIQKFLTETPATTIDSH